MVYFRDNVSPITRKDNSDEVESAQPTAVMVFVLQASCLWIILDSTLVYRILNDLYQKHMKEVFMFMKSMDIVSIVADKGTNLLVAD